MNSISYPNGRGKFIFRKGCIISSIDNYVFDDTFTFTFTSILERNKIPIYYKNINILLYLVIKCTFNDYINITLCRNPSLSDTKKTYKISGLHYSEIYANHILKSDEIIINNLPYTELSEELIFEYCDNLQKTLNLSIINNIQIYYKNKRNIIMNKPIIDKLNNTFNFKFVKSINGKNINNITELQNKSKVNNIIEYY